MTKMLLPQGLEAMMMQTKRVPVIAMMVEMISRSQTQPQARRRE